MHMCIYAYIYIYVYVYAYTYIHKMRPVSVGYLISWHVFHSGAQTSDLIACNIWGQTADSELTLFIATQVYGQAFIEIATPTQYGCSQSEKMECFLKVTSIQSQVHNQRKTDEWRENSCDQSKARTFRFHSSNCDELCRRLIHVSDCSLFRWTVAFT